MLAMQARSVILSITPPLLTAVYITLWMTLYTPIISVSISLIVVSSVALLILLSILCMYIHTKLKLRDVLKELKMADNDGKSKCFIVTGAAGGIGSDVCIYLASCGARVLAVDCFEDRLQDMMKRSPVVDKIYPFCADLGSGMSATKAVVDKALEIFDGQIDGLLLIHMYSHYQKILEISTDDLPNSLDRWFSINIQGNVFLIHALLPHLMKHHGYVGFASSLSTYMGAPKCALYTTCKAGMSRFISSVRLEIPQNTCSFSIVCLPACETPPMKITRPDMSPKAMLPSMSAAKEYVHAVLLRKYEVPVSGPGQPAGLVRFLGNQFPRIIAWILRREVEKQPLHDYHAELPNTSV